MTHSKNIITSVFLILISLTTPALAETNIPSKLNFKNAIDKSLSMIKESSYKDITVITNGGSLTGEYVKKTKEVLVLKSKTGSINLKSNKEKIIYIFVDLKSIVAISVNVLE